MNSKNKGRPEDAFDSEGGTVGRPCHNGMESTKRPDKSDLPLAEIPDDPRLLQAVEEYLSRLERGQTPNRHELLQRYPDLAGPLAQCLDGLELVHKTTGRPIFAERNGPVDSAGATGPTILQSEILPANPLGDFQVLREIGRGGMGIVYEAVQLSLGRRVALKVLPFAATFDATHLQRFHNEAQAAAQLHHTNIVPVYAVGRERGVHFYAMQLIEGQSLAAMIRQLRQDAGKPDLEKSGEWPVASSQKSAQCSVASGQKTPQGLPSLATDPLPLTTNSLTTDHSPLATVSSALSTQRSENRAEFYRSAARFMVQAAEAIEHAHQFGIVHRDIKPGNLMVDAHGRVWVTDFGLAQFHADAGLTQTGDVLGTLRYMSPEQASGQRVLLDHRTDVYSLGATLYELVTLEPIFPGKDRNELLHQIMNDEPHPPRSLEKNVPFELETIILKAVNKHPADRYSSAQAFAADLQRFLDDKPILATRPSLIERARKWSRRHPSFVVAAILLLFFGVVGFAVSTAMIADEQSRTHRAYEDLTRQQSLTQKAFEDLAREQSLTKKANEELTREQSLTQKAFEAERKRAGEAEQRFSLARRSADEMIRLAEEETANDPHMQNLRRLLLESALAYYQEFIELRRDDADAQVELAATRDRVQKILADLALLQGAGQHFLLEKSAVLDDLQLSEQQRTAIAELIKKMDKQRLESFREFHKLSAQERSKRFLESVRANEDALEKILDPEKRQRLRQIAWQCQGPMAFHEPDVIKALNLTLEESNKIRAIEDDMFFKRASSEHPGGPPMPPFSKENREAALRDIKKVLGEEKTKKWQDLIGRRFEGAERIFLPGAPPGPPPPPLGGFPPWPDGGKSAPFRPK